MGQTIVALVAALKAFQKVSTYVDAFISEWVKYDIDKLDDVATAKKEEYEVLNAKFKAAETDTEQRVLLRILARLR